MPINLVAEFPVPLFELAWGNLSYDQAIEKGEFLTQTALKLSLAAVMFFSYRIALPVGNPLLGVSLVVVNTCIHPAANIEALFWTGMIQCISSVRQGQLGHALAWWYSLVIPLCLGGGGETYCQRNPICVDDVQKMSPLQKIRYHSLWLDRKIITASKAAAPRIASFFRYQPNTN